MDQSVSGVIPILVTAFTKDGDLDIDSQLQVADHLLEQGAHGLGVFGNAGEGYALLPREKRRLLDAIVRHVDGRVPLIAGVGATGTDAAIEACRVAAGQGASVLMVLPPYYLRPDGDGLLFFYSAISDALQVPIMVQDAPMLSQVAMPPDLLARLAREVESVEYAKVEAPPTAPKISKILEACDGDLTLFGGLNGQFLIEEFQRGACGTMPASDMTSLYVSVWNALAEGRVKSAWETFTRALPLIRFQLQPGLGVSAVKHNFVHRGIMRSAFVRHPTRSLDRAGLRELADLRALVWPDRNPC